MKVNTNVKAGDDEIVISTECDARVHIPVG
jgi:hypothetical protein